MEMSSRVVRAFFYARMIPDRFTYPSWSQLMRNNLFDILSEDMIKRKGVPVEK